MADKDKDTEKETKPAEEKDASQPAASKTGILGWIIMVIVIMILSSSGFVVGRLIAGSGAAEQTAAAEGTTESGQTDTAKQDGQKAETGTWYYNELEPVIVNPDEPGATRFVRVGLILEISNALAQSDATAKIEAKKPLLVNWLNLYFKSLSLNQMKDERDMNRILVQIKDEFNDILFPEAKPQIENVLIREFNIQ